MHGRAECAGAVDCARMNGSASRLRIGLLIDRWQPERGGAERALDELARWLAERDFDVRVFARTALTQPPGQFHAVGARRWPFAGRGARERQLGEALASAAQSLDCDVTIGVRHLPRVDLYWPHGGSHAAALYGLRCARERRLLDPARVRVSGRHRVFIELERQLIAEAGARRVACVSRLVLDELAQRYAGAAARLVLIPNGVDTERFHPRERALSGAALRAELGLSAHTPLLTLGARNAALKGLPDLLEALAALQSRPWRLLVAGPQDGASWLRRARRAGLERERVTLVSDVDPVALAAAGDVCVLPSWRDTCGLVVLEALSCGTPVVTTRLCGAAESISAESTGSVIDHPGDVAALRAALERWLDRLRDGSIDREQVRAAVRGRERATWLGSIERSILELAGR